jgi:serine/threonine protein kinase/sugar lactone lactonase YvrE
MLPSKSGVLLHIRILFYLCIFLSKVFGITDHLLHLTPTFQEVSSTFTSIINSNGIKYYSNLTSFPSKAISISSGSHLSTSISPAIITGSNPFTVSSWIQCNTSLLSNENPSGVIVSLGANGEVSTSVSFTSFTLAVSSLDRVNMIATVTSFEENGFYGFSQPTDVDVDAAGVIYVADLWNFSVRKITLNGVVVTYGSGYSGFADGSGANALFKSPRRIAVDSFGNIFVADQNNRRIRKILTSSGEVTTFAGNGTYGLHDGIGTNAMFRDPLDVAIDPFGNLYVSEFDIIRKITSDGTVTTLGGIFNTIYGIAIDSFGNVFVAEAGANRIRKITQNGIVTTPYETSLGVDGITVDFFGNVFVADRFNHRILKVTPKGIVSTIAGSGSVGFVNGKGENALFSNPQGIFVDVYGTVYVADTGNHKIRKIVFNLTLPSPLPVCDSTWHHIALTYSGSSSTNTLTAYIDGENVASTSATFSISSSPSSTLRIGWNGLSTPNSEYFSGSLSDIRIYSRSLSASEIVSISQPPLQQYLSTDNPIPKSKSTVYTWKCSAGYFGPLVSISRSSSDGTWNIPIINCSSCPAGSYSSSGSSTCTLCPAGSFASSVGSRNCTLCDAGSFSSSIGSLNNCSSCPAGSTSTRGSHICTLCPSGSYSINSVTPLCVYCQPGTFSSFTGSASESTCLSCSTDTYSYFGSSSCASCSYSSAFISSSQSCQPPVINSGPIDTSFYLSGSQEEGIGVFSSSMSNTSGITFYANSSSFPKTALVFSNSSHVSTPFISFLPFGSSPFTISSWVKCSQTPLIVSNQSYSVNKSQIVIAWGEPRMSTNIFSNDFVFLSVTEASTQVKVSTLIGLESGLFANEYNFPYDFPGFITTDSLGNIYDWTQYKVRKISPDGKTITSFAGIGSYGTPLDEISMGAINSCRGIAVDSSNFIYILESIGSIRKISPTGEVSTLTYGPPQYPHGIYNFLVIDSAGNVYVSVTMIANAVYKISPSGDLTKFGRDGSEWGFADGSGTSAMFYYPQGLAIDINGNVYVADTNNYRIRKISTNGVVSTLAGQGSSGLVDGTGSNAMFSQITHLAIDSYGNLYVTDTRTDFVPIVRLLFVIRKITSSGVVTTFAGSTQGYSDGFGTASMFSTFVGIAVHKGDIFVSDRGNSRIRKISLSPSLPGPLPVCDSTWHHIALTYSGSSSTNTLTAYIDGENVASTSATFSISSSPSSTLRIGWNGLSTPNSEYFSGSLSDIRIYSRSLSASEIVSISQPPLHQYLSTDNPIPKSKSTVYTWKCSAGYFGPLVSISRSSSDGTWSQSGGEVNCQACSENSYTYIAGATSCSYCPTTFSAIISPILGCRPSSIYYNGPIDTSFFLSGSKEEGIDAFFISNKALSSWFIDTLSYPSVALIFSSGLFMSMPIVSSIPTGSSPFTVSSWILCSPSSFSESNPSSVIISWGKAESTPNVKTVLNSGNGSYISTVPSVLTSATLSVTSLARRESPELVVSTFAGNSYSYTDGIGTSAAFRDPYGIAVDKWGSLYVTDYGNHRIRKISLSGLVSTIAGGGTAAYVDGFGTSARFNNPIGVAVDGSSNLYIADSNNHCIRKITPSRVVTTIAGSGMTGQGSLLDETGTNARFNRPTGIAVDSFGTIAYIVDYGNNRVRKVIIASGIVTTLTGNGAIGYLDNSADTSKVVSPPGIVLDTAGNLFIGDSYNNRIRKISSSGDISTYAGDTVSGLADNIYYTMYPGASKFFSPGGVALDLAGNLYVADSWNQRIRKISPEGAVVTIAGSGNSGQDGGFENGVGTVAKFNRPYGIAVDTSGNVYIADSANNRIRKITITPRLPGPLPVCDSTWHHIALTYSGSSSTNTLTAYIDGSSVASTSATFIISSTSLSNLRIGWNGLSTPNSEYFSGSLSDIRIYSRSLSASEMLLLSNRQSSSSPRLSSAFPPASPSVTPSAGTILVTASIVFKGASADAYSDIRTIADLALGLETAIRTISGLTSSSGEALRVKIDIVMILTTNTIIYRIGSVPRRLSEIRSLQSNSPPVAVQVDYTVILPSSIASSVSSVSTTVTSNSFASIVVSQVSSAAMSSGNTALSTSFDATVTAEVYSPSTSTPSFSTTTLYGIIGGVVGCIVIISGSLYVYFFIYNVKRQGTKKEIVALNSKSFSLDDLSLTKNWRSPTTLEEVDDDGAVNVIDGYDIASSMQSTTSRTSNPRSISVSSTPTLSTNTKIASSHNNNDDDDDILPGTMSLKQDNYESVYNLSSDIVQNTFNAVHEEDSENSNRLFHLASSVFDGLSQAAGVLPFVGIALKGISILMDQVDTIYRVSKETEFLVIRLQRLQSVVKKAANDQEFCKQYSGIFENMVTTLQKASKKIEIVTKRGFIGKVIYGESDLEIFAKVDRALTMHLTEFTAAMQAETMGMIRTLYDENTGRSKKGKIDIIAPVPVEALPPFSMRFKTSDLIFDPPLEKQMLTAPRGSYGVVVFAHWKINNLPCAVKLIPARTPTGAPAFSIMSWLSEAELMRRLREHLNSVTRQFPKNICVLFGIGAVETPNGDVSHYLVVMERLQGSLRELLDSYLKKGRQPPLDQALNWLRDVANGISECHDANVVHSDIKAANVLLTKKREAKVGDLGAGRVTRDVSSTASVINSTGGNVVRGSLPWLSSELIEDQSMQPSKASDVYAWACFCWEILSCRIPYHNELGELVVDLTKLRNINAIVTGKLRPDLSLLRPDAPSSIVDIMKRAWDAEPRDRPLINEVLETLDAAITSFKEAKKGNSIRAAEAAAADLRSEALLTAAANLEEEDARKAMDDLETLTASLETARASRIDAIRKKHDEILYRMQQETEVEQKRMEEDARIEIAAEVKKNEAQLVQRKAQWMSEITQAKDLRLRNSSRLDEKDRLRILSEYDTEQRTVDIRLEAIRVEQTRALEDKLRLRREAKIKATEENVKKIDAEIEKELSIVRDQDIHEFLLD